MLDLLRSDFARHGGKVTNPSVWLLAVHRGGKWVMNQPRPIRWIGGKIYGALNLCMELTTGSSIPREAEIGDSPHLIHFFDIRIHPGVVLGDRVGIMHEVTIGSTQGRNGVPRIGSDVFIGPGAKILGPVTIGDGAKIAPNAVVISNVPAGATAMGAPARCVRVGGLYEKKANGKVTDITERIRGRPSEPSFASDRPARGP